MDKVDPAISKYFSDLSNRRKVKRGGFQSPEVQARIQAKLKAQREKKSLKESQSSSETSER